MVLLEEEENLEFDFAGDGVVEQEAVTDTPHWDFEREYLYDRLRPMELAARDAQDLVSKVFLISQEEGSVIFRADTGGYKIEIAVRLENKEFVLDGEYVVEIKPFMAVVKNAAHSLLFTEVDGALTARVRGGEVSLESYNLDPDVFRAKVFEVGTENMQKCQSDTFHKFLVRVVKTMSLSKRPEDRRCRVEDGVSLCNYVSSMVVYKNVSVDNISLRGMDFSFLATVVDADPDFYFWDDGLHYWIFSGRTKVSIPKIETGDLSSLLEGIHELHPGWSFCLDSDDFSMILRMLKGLIGDNGTTKIQAKDGKMELLAYTKSGRKQKFTLAQTDLLENETMDVEFPIPAVSLFRVGELLRNEETCRVTIVESGQQLSFLLSDMRIIFGGQIK